MIEKIKNIPEWIKNKLNCSSCSCSLDCTVWKKIVAAAVIGICIGVVVTL